MNLDACIICGSSENLNTSMTIDIDGEKFSVNICDADADTATPKLVKGHFLTKKSEIDDIIAKARELGLEVNVPSAPGKIAIVHARPSVGAPVPADPAAVIQTDPTTTKLDPAIASVIAGSKEDGILPTSIVDGVAQRVQGAAGGETMAEQHAAYAPGSGEDKLDPALLEGKVKMEAGQGRGGQPIAIPSVRVDQTGTTTVRVRQDINDHELQRRFKTMANEIGPDGANKHSFAAGYAVHNCPICKGDGVTKQRGKLETCPKCKGTGLLNS